MYQLYEGNKFLICLINQLMVMDGPQTPSMIVTVDKVSSLITI
jgi:hypothetical protein